MYNANVSKVESKSKHVQQVRSAPCIIDNHIFVNNCLPDTFVIALFNTGNTVAFPHTQKMSVMYSKGIPALH